ncbi:MAG: hypothetical protein JWM27_3479 [Gemmatimonadetes bacterium]|nr:hypothetical protein [Gemmatimonadota bacterium]
MELKRYEVEVVYRQTARYSVEAPDRAAAERAATAHWKRGDVRGEVGPECCELESVRVVDLPGEDARAADRAAALRFLRDRELVIERLSDDAFNPCVHDALSAEEVARHVGWTTEADEADAARASRALERLCSERRVVCFSRPRVRTGERGDIRLYCTPQHLERLSMLMIEDPSGAPAGAV